MAGAELTPRRTWAEVDLDALAHNVGVMRRLVAPARVCAVVKADAYGHGSVPVARAALAAGAEWLAVALAEEGDELRRAGVEAPVLVLAEPRPEEMADLLAAGLVPTVYTREGVVAATTAATSLRMSEVPVHLKVDTGMHRVGAAPKDAIELARAIGATGCLRLQGLWTHLAVADQPGDCLTGKQLERFDSVSAALSAVGIEPRLRHAANSAGAIWHPRSRYDLVRAGIAIYGYHPTPNDPWPGAAGSETPHSEAPDSEAASSPLDLRPVLSLHSQVALVRECQAGERVSYGQRRALPGRSWVATIPIGYADGVSRRLFDSGMEVLVRGRRCPLAGTVTMDQILVDCGPRGDVAVGDEVVLIGRQGEEAVTADDWAGALGTISYEVLCGIGPRVPRAATSTMMH